MLKQAKGKDVTLKNWWSLHFSVNFICLAKSSCAIRVPHNRISMDNNLLRKVMSPFHCVRFRKVLSGGSFRLYAHLDNAIARRLRESTFPLFFSRLDKKRMRFLKCLNLSIPIRFRPYHPYACDRALRRILVQQPRVPFRGAILSSALSLSLFLTRRRVPLSSGKERKTS